MIDLYDGYKHTWSKHGDREHTDREHTDNETKKTTTAHHLGDFVNHYIENLRKLIKLAIIYQ
jgi:predicted phosphodiesterase